MSGDMGVLNHGKWFSELTMALSWMIPPNVARVLVKYYASIYSTYAGREPQWPTTINAPHYTSAAVHKVLSALDIAKCSGSDDLNPFMLQILADFLAEPITTLYNKSLQSGEVPQDWWTESTCPIFKKGEPEDRSMCTHLITICIITETIFGGSLSQLVITSIDKCDKTFI